MLLKEYWVYTILIYCFIPLQSLQALQEVSIVTGFSIGAPIGGLLQAVCDIMMCLVWLLTVVV